MSTSTASSIFPKILCKALKVIRLFSLLGSILEKYCIVYYRPSFLVKKKNHLYDIISPSTLPVPRSICVDEGQELSLAYGCQFYEVSAAENFAGVSLAFQTLLREARSVQMLKALPIRRKLGVNSVSKVLGTLFGKNYNKTGQGDKRKKRPSLSI